MEFPFDGLGEVNGSDPAADQGESLYSREPVVAAPYVGVLGVAAVVGTLGNLVVIITVIMKHLHSRRHLAETTGNDAGRVFIANLAFSDMTVTAVINPLAIAGSSMISVVEHLIFSCCSMFFTRHLILRPPSITPSKLSTRGCFTRFS